MDCFFWVEKKTLQHPNLLFYTKTEIFRLANINRWFQSGVILARIHQSVKLIKVGQLPNYCHRCHGSGGIRTAVRGGGVIFSQDISNLLIQICFCFLILEMMYWATMEGLSCSYSVNSKVSNLKFRNMWSMNQNMDSIIQGHL